MKNTNTCLHLNIILLPLFISNGRGAVGMVVFGWSLTVAYALQSLVKEIINPSLMELSHTCFCKDF